MTHYSGIQWSCIYLTRSAPFGPEHIQDYLARYPAGGAQHFTYRLPVSDFEEVLGEYRAKGYPITS